MNDDSKTVSLREIGLFQFFCQRRNRTYLSGERFLNV